MAKRFEGKNEIQTRIVLKGMRFLSGFIFLTVLTIMVFIGGSTTTALASQIGNGVTVSGTVESCNPNNKTEIQLMQGAVEVDKIVINGTFGSGQVTQSFAFEGVAPGTYSLVITKKVHTKFTVQNIIVGTDNVDLSQNERSDVRVMALRCGDINENGMIDSGDLSLLWQQSNYNRKVGDIGVNSLCDLNGDGMVNDGDLTILWHSANYNKGAVVISLTGSITTKYTVIFKDWDGRIMDTQLVTYGLNAIPPVAPPRTGYIFTGWDVSYLTITADTVVTATYVASDGLNFFSVTNASGKPGDIVTVTVSIGSIVDTCGFDLRLLYDSNVLEYVDNNSDLDLDVVVNHVPEDHEIRFNYCATRNRSISAKIMELSFRIKSVGSATGTILIEPVEIICIDESNDNALTLIGVNVINGTVTVN